MARGKGNLSLKHRDVFELFRRLPAGRLIELIEKAFPASEIKQLTPQTFRMRCPTPGHPDVHPSCTIDLRKGVVACQTCKYMSMNLLQMFQDCLGWSYAEGLKKIQEFTGARLVPEKRMAEFEELDLHREALRLIAWSVNAHLIRMVSPPEGNTAYDPIAQHTSANTLAWIFERRGHKKDTVHLLPYGLWPSQQHLLSMCEERLNKIVEEAYRGGVAPRFTPERREKILESVRSTTEEIGTEWVNSVAFVTGHDFTSPARIKLRRPDEEDRKNGNIIVLKGYQGDPNGYFGLYSPYLAGLTKQDTKAYRVLIVEGENDALTINEGLIEAGISGWICMASCGNAAETDALADAGFDEVYLLLDHPGQDVGRGEVWLRERLTTAKLINCRVFSRWEELRASNGFVKDPDDAIRLLGFDHFRRVVLDNPDKAFIGADEWAYDRAIEDARGLPEVRERVAVAAKYGECLQNPAQLANYLDKIAVPLEVSAGVVRGMIVEGQDDEAGFISRVATTFHQDLHFLYKENSPRGAMIHAHHKTTQRPLMLPADDGAGVMSALSNVSGDMYTYFDQRVGLPKWLLDQQVQAAGVPMVRDLQKPLADYTRIAMQRVFHNLPAKDECNVLGLGPHKLGDAQYLNTGRLVYRSVFDKDEHLSWSQLSGPSDGKTLFLSSNKIYTGMAQSVEDLEWGNKVTLDEVRSILDDLTAIANLWGFRRGSTESLLVALLIFHHLVPHFCPDKILTGLTGQTSSGKSTLMALFCGGQYPDLQLVDAAGYSTNYSASSLFNGYHAATILMGLEEFTSDEMHGLKAKQVEDIIEIVRQMIFPGGARVQRVYAGVVQERVLHTNGMMSSIHPPRDIQDANRRLEIETTRIVGHKNPAVEIFKLFPPERFAYMRRVLNLGLFKFQHRYETTMAVIAKELATTDLGLTWKVDTRFLRNFVGPATWFAVMGGDWRAFVRKCVENRKDTLNAYAHSTPSNILFDTILRTGSIRIGNAFTSALALLSESDKSGLLNTGTSGLYYNDERGYLVIDWIGVLSNGGVLFRSEPWGKEQYHRLKYQLDQHHSAVQTADMPSLGVDLFLRACGTTAEPHNISVLRLGDMVMKIRDMSKRKTTIGEQKEKQADNPGDASQPPGLRKRNNL